MELVKTNNIELAHSDMQYIIEHNESIYQIPCSVFYVERTLERNAEQDREIDRTLAELDKDDIIENGDPKELIFGLFELESMLCEQTNAPTPTTLMRVQDVMDMIYKSGEPVTISVYPDMGAEGNSFPIDYYKDVIIYKKEMYIPEYDGIIVNRYMFTNEELPCYWTMPERDNALLRKRYDMEAVNAINRLAAVMSDIDIKPPSVELVLKYHEQIKELESKFKGQDDELVRSSSEPIPSNYPSIK